ncbi:hypothetical protein SNOG_02653 [Parastagonospora nodorum SN15]|uniref:Uncharacterized protein n=1 Tax=Phaeosphaeria nodorum (strain SN15 / ATCC MYA-4574 / FGSC 10173) TaxID=321614 RepID=Q0V011_PHANO|nr:hypothetical protein SNOG_02653 [Parastagonospora nodorum SN15]EAT89384.1 hypothetical protein SNOG_02653 [Parastagonospora nodorum SN15]
MASISSVQSWPHEYIRNRIILEHLLMGTMGKNKNKSKNKSRKSDENFRKEATDAPEKRIVPVTASSLTTSSSFASRDPSPTHRTSDSTSELPILPSCSGPVGQSILKANDEKRDSVISSTWGRGGNSRSHPC